VSAADEPAPLVAASPLERRGHEGPRLAGRLWAVLLTGIPFSVFKVGGGLAAVEDIGAALGWLVVAWGGIDALLNLGALFWPGRSSYCLLSNLGRAADRRAHRRAAEPCAASARARWRRYEQLGLALDTLLAFIIVATMIWFGRIGSLSPLVQRVWELSVIANILGVGIERVWRSWRGE
jgi:hypothetical protein